MALRDRIAALLGVSTYQAPKRYGPELDSSFVERMRTLFGGNLNPPPTTRLRWYLDDLEAAQHLADTGYLELCGQLWRAMRRDGRLVGLMSTLSGGVVALPKKFYGKHGVEELRSRNGTRSVYENMVPSVEAGLMVADGRVCGAAIGELLPVEGRDYPVLCRLDPTFLQYQWNENRWYYNSIAGRLPITPGDGRWVLHLPGGRVAPWTNGLWPALGRSFINKEHAMLHRSNYSGKLANPARVAEAPAGADEPSRIGFVQSLLAWGLNTVIELPPGWKAYLLESKGEGYKVFQDEIDTSDKEFAVTICGQEVTVDGGVGFQNSDLFRAIRADIIKDVAGGWDHTVNTQILPSYIANKFGEAAIDEGAVIESDIARPKDLTVEAASMTALAGAIKSLREALEGEGRTLNVDELTKRFGVPIKDDNDGDGAPDTTIEAADTDEETSEEAVLN